MIKKIENTWLNHKNIFTRDRITKQKQIQSPFMKCGQMLHYTSQVRQKILEHICRYRYLYLFFYFLILPFMQRIYYFYLHSSLFICSCSFRISFNFYILYFFYDPKFKSTMCIQIKFCYMFLYFAEN